MRVLQNRWLKQGSASLQVKKIRSRWSRFCRNHRCARRSRHLILNYMALTQRPVDFHVYAAAGDSQKGKQERRTTVARSAVSTLQFYCLTSARTCNRNNLVN
ncbi:hypothetical protein M378DRAFT_362087 [Amanita muscaria Koide BX008]|uniref:Uncharacterized protein n=1 Tax=Amanita muscaria (strain Koide BX008) TaxID=946122 RepID=A0A0C2W948_AMAMK|nr:hypothetical protein M378DRAFT_362087 [Amanita muscaria Koide BX008]